MRLLDVTARICANICAYVDSEAPMVTDAYSTAYELNAEHRIVRLMRLTDIFTDTSLCKGRLELSAAGITSVVDLWCAGITAAAAPRDGQLAVTGTATVCILLVDSGGELQYVERQMDYEYLRRLGEVGGNIQCDPSVTVSALDYVMGSEGRLDVRLELSVTASVFEVIEKKVITDLTLLEEHSKEQKAAALTIYYCDAGENVWDIAVRYNTTVQAIMSENQLTEEMVPEKCMLLIPSA